MRSRRCLVCDVFCFLKANGNRQVPKWPPVNSVMNYLSTGAGLQLSTVSFTTPMTLSNEKVFWVGTVESLHWEGSTCKKSLHQMIETIIMYN